MDFNWDEFKHKVYNCVILYAIGLTYFVYEFIGSRFNLFPVCKVVDLQHQGQTAIVTGGSRGIGYEAVKTFLKAGIRVIIGSSSAAETRKKIEDSFSTFYPNAKVEVWHLDLESLDSVKEFSEKFYSLQQPLNYLINNAGIMFVPYKLTDDNFESHFQVNYLSHCLLTQLLIPKLIEGSCSFRQSRIVNVSSLAHYGGNIKFDDLQSRKYYSCHQGYMQSKLAQILYARELQSYFTKNNLPVTVNCIHPGIVKTDLHKEISKLISWFAHLYMGPKKGAETLVFATLDSSLERKGGLYLMNNIIFQPSPWARDAASQNRLFNLTHQLIKKWLSSN